MKHCHISITDLSMKLTALKIIFRKIKMFNHAFRANERQLFQTELRIVQYLGMGAMKKDKM